MNSDAVEHDRKKLLQQALEHGEFVCLQCDGLVRQSRKLIGQVDYRKSKERRNMVALGDDVAIRCVYQVRGTSGTPLLSKPIMSERAESIRHMFIASFTTAMRQQVRS